MLPISGPVEAQAEKFDKAINGAASDFTASQGRLWQKRHGISQHQVVGEMRSANQDGAAQFPPKLMAHIADNNLSGEQVYNADETGLFFKNAARSHVGDEERCAQSRGIQTSQR